MATFVLVSVVFVWVASTMAGALWDATGGRAEVRKSPHLDGGDSR